MTVYYLNITLNSELCVATGSSIAGLVDTETAHQKGFPYIPSKRIKGALHGVARELVDWGLADKLETKQLFGRAGAAESSPLHVYDGVLYQVPDPSGPDIKKKDVGEIDVDVFSQYSSESILEMFTSLRTHTALEGQVAKSHSLRTIRTVNKGIVFRSKIVLADETQLELLKQCVKGLRHLGIGRTRGLGEVECVLAEAQTVEATLSRKPVKPTNEVVFRLTLEQPLLIAGQRGLYHSSEDWIPGSTILGALAGMYITDHRLGEEAHKDEAFSRIFLQNGVKFHYAYPEHDGKVFVPCPGHFQQNKKNPTEIYDVFAKRDQLDSEDVILRSVQSLIYLEDSTVYVYEPKKEIRMHHSRPADRGVGRALGKEDDPQSGQFFQYTSLSAKQTFYGTWQGSTDDLQALIACIEKRNGQLRLGRSRTAEYGTVTMEFLDEPKPVLTNQLWPNEEYVAICLLTPMLLIDDYGRANPDPDQFLKEVEQELMPVLTLKPTRKFIKQTTLSGYNSKWRMPKPQIPALDAGTVLIVKNQQVDWEKVEQRLWGQQTGAGYGRVKVMGIKDSQASSCFSKIEVSFSPEKMEDKGEFTEWVLQQLKHREQQKLDLANGSNVAKRAMEDNDFSTNIGQTSIHQMAELMNIKNDGLVIKLIKEVKKKTKQVVMEKMFEDCKNQSRDFREGYFQTLKYQVRGGARGQTK
ncbi:hypothetical protein CHH77_15120 [Shouchella clausii]|uniref:RAMP superfamily CRISPR-associated protein n=1 Tax=Shouchella clausii TaxID=79880 RepID=UPI000BA66E8D|nr:RAMP superfamily CRISPR-associated protein [Shouchella clausii]PAE81095.1 hypothetical protein CHH77_15120 [Shouchella clausii]